MADVNDLIDRVTGVTQKTVAEWVGVSIHAVREWRRGRRQPSQESLERLTEGALRHAEAITALATALRPATITCPPPFPFPLPSEPRLSKRARTVRR
jgi:transcriptional regulator with XRE-family HTH domain